MGRSFPSKEFHFHVQPRPYQGLTTVFFKVDQNVFFVDQNVRLAVNVIGLSEQPLKAFPLQTTSRPRAGTCKQILLRCIFCLDLFACRRFF